MPLWLTPFLFFAAATATASVDIYLPYAPFLKNLFKTQEWVMQLSILINPFAASFTGFLFGHFSESMGRKSVFLWSLIIFSLGSLAQGFCDTIEWFLIFRLVQAVGVGGIHILTLAILSDSFTGPRYARHVATFGVMYPVTFALAPMIGAQIFTYVGWRHSFFLLCLLSALLAWVFYQNLPETKPKKKHDEANQKTTLFKGLKELTKDTYFMRMSLVHSLPISISVIFLANSAFIFIEYYHFTPQGFSYVQALPFIANIMGNFLYQWYVTHNHPQNALKVGFTTISLFLVGSFATLLLHETYSVVMILVSFGIFNFGLGFKAAASATLAFESLPENKGIGIAYFSCLRNMFSTCLAMASATFYTGTITPVFISMMIIGVVVLLVMKPLVFRPNL